MSRRGEAREDVESGQPLPGREDNDYIDIGDAVEEDDSGEKSLSLDVEDSCARLSPVTQADNTYHDRGWAYAFKTNVIATIIAAVYFRRLALKVILARMEQLRWGTLPLPDSLHEFGWLSVFGAELGLVTVTVGFAIFILYSLISCGKPVVQSSVALTHVLWLVMVLILGGIGKHTWAFLALVAFPIITYTFYRGRNRFPFGVATLKVAAVAIKSMPGTIFTSLLMVGVQFLWVLVCLIAALGSSAYLKTVEGPDGSMHLAIDCGSRIEAESHETQGCYCMDEMISEGACTYRVWGLPLMLLWLVPIGWGFLVTNHIVTCTVSGSVAAWWYSPKDVNPVKGAFYRATRYSFGTLCKAGVSMYFGIFLLSIVKVMMWVPGVSCLYRVGTGGIMYWHDYTVTFVGIYGLDMVSAFRKVHEVLFARRGATCLANDLIAYLATCFLMLSTSVTFGVMIGVVLAGMLVSVKTGSQVMVQSVFCAIPFSLVIATLVEVVRSAVKAVLVCFIQDPGVLKNTRGHELHDELTVAWKNVHPEDEPKDDTAHPTELLNTAHSHTQ